MPGRYSLLEWQDDTNFGKEDSLLYLINDLWNSYKKYKLMMKWSRSVYTTGLYRFIQKGVVLNSIYLIKFTISTKAKRKTFPYLK